MALSHIQAVSGQLRHQAFASLQHLRAWCWPWVLLLAAFVSICFAESGFTQSPNAAVIRAEGSFLRGLGSYNLNTARADSINTDTVIRWKQDLRKIHAERNELQARTAAGKKLRLEEVRERLRQQEIELRLNPSPEDVRNGKALNALLFDLTDPDVSSADWSSKVIQLPEGMSVKDLIFQFTPSSNASSASKALSKGVIALSLLDIEGKWPTVMKQDALDAERIAYERAYATLRTQLLSDMFNVNSLNELDKALNALKVKVSSAVPKARGFRDEALKFVDDLTSATRFFDAATIDYAKEILVDTKDHDATTVGELVGFMLKYRLQFASAERSANGRVLYGQLYEVMQQEIKLLGIKPAEIIAAPGDPSQPPSTNIAAKYTEARKSAARNLLAAFDKQILAARKNPQLSADDKRSLAFSVTAEKLAFEQHGVIPFSPSMREHAMVYLKSLAEADANAATAYDEQIERMSKAKDDRAAAHQRTEKEITLAPSIVGSWKVTRLDSKGEMAWTLYSNGKLGETGSWVLDQSNLIGKVPGAKAPGGTWINTCVIDKDGQSFRMSDQTNKQFIGVLVKQKD